MRRCVVAIFLFACAPQIDGPTDHQRAIDREDADHLAAQLAELPGAVRAQVTLHRAVRDPFAMQQQPPPASAAAIVVIDDRADRPAITAAAARLIHATAPEIADTSIDLELGAVRPELAHVGPFTVEAGSRARLVAVLAASFALIAVLAGWLAWRYSRRGNSAQ